MGAFVLRCRFGFQTGEPETLDVIGRRRGVTRERIRQIEKQALDLLKEHVQHGPLVPAAQVKKGRAKRNARPIRGSRAVPTPVPRSNPQSSNPLPRRAFADVAVSFGPLEPYVPRRAVER